MKIPRPAPLNMLIPKASSAPAIGRPITTVWKSPTNVAQPTRQTLGRTGGDMPVPACSVSVGLIASPLSPTTGLELYDQWNALQPVALAHPVLEQVGVVARHLGAVVDLDGEARRARLELGHVVEAQGAGGPWGGGGAG